MLGKVYIPKFQSLPVNLLLYRHNESTCHVDLRFLLLTAPRIGILMVCGNLSGLLKGSEISWWRFQMKQMPPLISVKGCLSEGSGRTSASQSQNDTLMEISFALTFYFKKKKRKKTPHLLSHMHHISEVFCSCIPMYDKCILYGHILLYLLYSLYFLMCCAVIVK